MLKEHERELNDKIAFIIERSGLNNSSFAHVLEVQPPVISHILNYRNKPGLDFLQKLGRKFPSLQNLRWTEDGEILTEEDLYSIKTQEEKSNQKTNSLVSKKKKIIKVVFFYDDHSFEEFYPN